MGQSDWAIAPGASLQKVRELVVTQPIRVCPAVDVPPEPVLGGSKSWEASRPPVAVAQGAPRDQREVVVSRFHTRS